MIPTGTGGEPVSGKEKTHKAVPKRTQLDVMGLSSCGEQDALGKHIYCEQLWWA